MLQNYVKISFYFLVLILCSHQANAVYIPLQLTGFNADVVADVAGNALGSTNNDVDGVNYVFMSQSYNTSGTSYMPISNIVNSVVASTPGLTYNLQPYTANNSLRIGNGGSGMLTATNLVSAEKVYVLGCTGSGNSTVTITVTFTDGTTQVFTGQSIPDWFGGANFAIQGMGRTVRNTNVITNSATEPRLYQTELSLAPANFSKIIQSISFNTTGGILNIMAVTAFNNIPCSGTPVAGAVTINPAVPCPGSPLTLSLSGNALAGNLAYQWFRGTTSNGPWVPLPNSNALPFSYTPPSGSTFCFICVVTCTNTGQVDTATVACINIPAYTPCNACYCPSYATSLIDEEITNFTIGGPAGINNTTSCASGLTGSQGVATGTANSYSDFTCTTVPVPTLLKGVPQSFSFTIGTCGTANFNSGVKIFIDYNRNNTFSDVGEEVYYSGSTAIPCVPATTVSGSFTIPISAINGPTRLRIVDVENGHLASTNIPACGPYTYGETEDYAINIQSPQAYDPALVGVTLPSGNCFSTLQNVTLSITNYGTNLYSLFTSPLTLYVVANGPNGVQTQSYLLQSVGQSLSPLGGNVMQVQVSGLNFSAGGTYSVTAYLSAPAGFNGNLLNDTLGYSTLTTYNPTPGQDYNLCQGYAIPFGQGLTASGCATPNYDSLIITFNVTPTADNVGATTTGTSQGPSNANCGNLYAGNFGNATVPLTIPTGAQITSAQLSVSNLSVLNSFNYQNEVRFNLYSGSPSNNLFSACLPQGFGVPNTLTTVGVSTGIGSGFSYARNISPADIGSMYAYFLNNPTASLNLGYWESFNDHASTSDINANVGGSTVARLKIYYQYVPSNFEWYDVPTGGSVLYNSVPFNPLSVPNAVVNNSNTPGTYPFYVACQGSSNCRSLVNLVINPTPNVFQDTLVLCENPVGSNGATFDLTTMNNAVSGGNPPNIVVNYTGDLAGFISILDDTAYLSSTNFVFSEVKDTISGCINRDSLYLDVVAAPNTIPFVTGNACYPSYLNTATLLSGSGLIPAGSDTLFYSDPAFSIPHPNPYAINLPDTVYVIVKTNSTPSCMDTIEAYIDVQGAGNYIANQVIPGNYSTCGIIGTNVINLNDGVSDTARTSTDCMKVAAVYDVPDGTNLGAISVYEEVVCPTPFYNGQPYLNRWYEFTPTNNDSAYVCLFYLDEDINSFNNDVLAYNTANGTNWPLLNPTTNMAITKVSGGVLGSGGSTAVTIPTSLITSSYDANTTVWTVCFPVDGFSSFYGHTLNGFNAPLPVTLLSFEGKRVDSRSVLSWVTATEQNNSHFVVERSKDSRTFNAISDQIPSKATHGNSSTALSYGYTDSYPVQGHNYYRLQQVDIDGNKSYSKVVDVYYNDETMITLYPNPAEDLVNLDINVKQGTEVKAQLLDATGRIVKEESVRLVVGLNQHKMDISSLADGVYMLKLTNGRGVNYTQTLRKK